MSLQTQSKKTFEPLSEGDYLVRMNRLNEKTSKAGNLMLSAGFEVIKKVGTDAEGENRLIFENFLLEHTNENAVKISRDRISKYLKAVGVDGGLESLGEDVSKVTDFLEIPFIASVKIQEGSNGFGPSNKITAFKQR